MDNDELLSLHFKVISILSSPQLNEIEGPVNSVDQIFESNLSIALKLLQLDIVSPGNETVFKTLHHFGIDRCKITDGRWTYCCLCLETILEICKLLDEKERLYEEKLTSIEKSENEINGNLHHPDGIPPIPPVLISMKSEREVAKCIQLIIATGLLPYLHPRIGVPIEKRLKLHFFSDIQSKQLSEQEMYYRLTTTLQAVYEIVKNQMFGPQLLVKHLTDLLAVFLQVCYAPLKKPMNSSEVLLIQTIQEERKKFLILFDSFADRIYPPLLVQSLLLLQGPSPSHAKIIRDALAPAPLWLMKNCARLLSRELIKPNGVIVVIQGVTELSSDMWQRCDSLAHIISTPPSREVTKQQEYYSIIGPQLINLVRQSHKAPLNKRYIQIGAACFRNIGSRFYTVAEPYMFKPLFDSLRNEDEESVVYSVEALHNIFVRSSDPSEFLKVLLPQIKHLLQIYRKWNRGILHARVLLEELLVRVFVHCDSFNRLDALRTLLIASAASGEDFLDDDESNIKSILTLLQSINDSSLTFAMFISLLGDIPNLMKQPDSQQLVTDLSSVRRGLIVSNLIGALADDSKLQKYLMENPERFVDFAQTFLQRSVENLKHCDLDRDLEKEMLSIVFAVVGIQISNLAAAEQEKMWSLFDPLVSLLETLAQKHPVESTRDGADELRIAIKTRGFAFESKRVPDQANAFQEALKELSDPLLPVQGHGLLTISKLLKQKDREALEHKEKLLEVFLKTLEHEDSYIYLMGIQALTALADVYTDIVLKALVQQFDAVIVDSNVKADPKLVVEIPDEGSESQNCPMPSKMQRPPEVRLKVGEALLKVVRLIGPLVPKYKNILLHSFLCGTKDDDPFVRVSSLQNLGELCGLLRYSLDSVTYELLNCVSHLITRDPAVEVRRGAASLITLLLRGLDIDALKVLEPIMKDLYRILKEIVWRDNDDKILTFHASQALEKLAEIVTQFLNVSSFNGRKIQGL